jgi:hypothetical protein
LLADQQRPPGVGSAGQQPGGDHCPARFRRREPLVFEAVSGAVGQPGQERHDQGAADGARDTALVGSPGAQKQRQPACGMADVLDAA